MNHELPKYYPREESEEKWKTYWEKEGIYEFKPDVSRSLYVVDTPPPYVSADHLHTGHIMSYAQAEFIVRYKRMRGFNVFYPMGFDDNGLPTERFVEKKYQIDKSKITKSEFIELCLKETEIGSQSYKGLWKDLGISVDWSKTYSTISPVAVKTSQWSLIDLYKKGHLYQAEAPVLWCTTCRTALAQADLEDREEGSFMNDISFPLVDGGEVIIATTRPEMLPACVALYVNPADERYSHLLGKKAIVPLFSYEIPILASKNVDKELGTGFMMVCTWGDQEDVEKWREDKLDTRSLVQEDGRLGSIAGPHAGIMLSEARTKIIEALKMKGHLLKQEPLTHSLNVHERCGTPTEFILSKQWFIKVADKKEMWLELGERIHWYPTFKKNDYVLWVNSLKWDWCVSRQRYYGVPFPVWFCSGCKAPLFAPEELLPVNPTEDPAPFDVCPHCGLKEFTPETSVMDTWATSSCTPFLLRELIKETGSEAVKEKMFPVSLRPNGFEIIRTWDFYSIVKGFYHFGLAPFENLMISGHGLDDQGRKISKRLGNYIPAADLLKEYGADAIRYWATGAVLGQNLRFSTTEVEKGKKTTIKLWNVARLMNMYVGLEKDERMELKNLEPVDGWILEELNMTIEKATNAFDEYAYAKAKEEIDLFFWSKLADYYLEFVKYRLSGENTISKNAAIATLQTIFLSVLKLYAPILPFITEELYQTFYRETEKTQSIHLSSWPEKIRVLFSTEHSDFSQAIEAINEIRKFKSEQNLSLGTEIEEYSLHAAVDLEKYGEFISKVMRVKILKV